MGLTELDRRVLKIGYTKGIHKGQRTFYQRLNLKRSTTDYVLEKLKRERMLTRSSYEVNLPALGIKRFAWLFLSVNWVAFDEEKFMKKALGFPEIGSVLKVTGDYDYAVYILGKSIAKINEFVIGFERIFQDEIEGIDLRFANREYKRHYILVSPCPTYTPNRVDCLLLDEKLKNPGISLAEISKKYKIHRNTVSNRWRKIWKNKVLLKEHLELTEAGFRETRLGLKLFVIIKPVPGKEEKLIRHLAGLEEVENIFTTLSNEIVLNVRVEDSPSLGLLHNKMIMGLEKVVKNSKTVLVMGGRKKPYLPMQTLTQINENVCSNCFEY